VRSDNGATATEPTVLDGDDSNVERADDTQKRPLEQRMLRVLWDSLDKTLEEREFVHKVDCWIMSCVHCVLCQVP
jgi:hypothetical protein